MNAVNMIIRNLVANAIVSDRGPANQYIGRHMMHAATGIQGDPMAIAIVAWEHLSPRIDVDVSWLDHPTWHQWAGVIDAAKAHLSESGHLEFAHYANGKPMVPTRIVYPDDVHTGAWIRRVRAECLRTSHGAPGLSHRASDDWGPAFHQVVSIRAAYPPVVRADALTGREPTVADRQYLFLGDDGRPLHGFAYPVAADLAIEMIP